jgi:hypothetical protein
MKQAMPQSCGRRNFAMWIFKQVVAAAIMGVLAELILSGCAAQPAPPPARPANRYIYVTAQNLPGECYTNLGSVSVSQSFAEAAVDAEQTETAKRMRAAALRDYPDDVDAVINVQSHQNDSGTAVTVTGEAVRLEDHPTVQCTLRGSEGVMDQAALIGAGGIAGATVGGLVGGSSGATSAGVAGAAAMGAHEVMEHEAAKEQQQEDFEKTLDEQRREIAQLLKERAQLLKCQESEVPLKVCLASPPPSAGSSQDESAITRADQDTVDASPFQIRKHLQEQQDYIKQLQDQIEHIEWQMTGH